MQNGDLRRRQLGEIGCVESEAVQGLITVQPHQAGDQPDLGLRKFSVRPVDLGEDAASIQE